MARSSYAARPSRSLPCIINEASSGDSSHSMSVANLSDTTSAQFDALWHFDCVVSPRSSLPNPLIQSKLENSPSNFSSTSAQLPAMGTSTIHTSFNPISSTTAQNIFANQFLQTVFSTFDENGDGSVSVTETSTILERLGMPASEQSIQSFLRRLLSSTKTHVKEDEFLALYETVCCYLERLDTSSSSSDLQYSEDRDLLQVFRLFDRDGNGFITPQELQMVLSSLGFPEAAKIDACVEMIARVDENGDGQVDFVQFKRLFHPGVSLFPRHSIQTF
ncbi:hypothetical protein KP509_35G008400 [Ceratopteris richardii]|uniref:EF-hand domain-containing protein n=1 Tax=Ceratopteris richardii TaxID=49495 RepID=A0A8T2QE87_CERRI|nr:hypothetical protein KP509_35G008400 [Ceratopteris richardii]